MTLPTEHPWQVRVGDRDVTRHVDTLTYSNADPGGFEMATITLANPIEAPRAGDRVTVRYGLEVAWDGRVNDPGNASRGDRIVEQIAAVGFGAILKDNTYRQVFRDIDQTRWVPASVQRRINLLAVNLDTVDPSNTPDDSTGEPSVTTELRSPFSRTSQAEAWYSSQGIGIAKVAYGWKKSANIASPYTGFSWNVFTADDDIATNLTGTSNLADPGPGSGTHTASAGHKWAYVRLNKTAITTDSNVARSIWWTHLAVYGDHGITVRGTEPAAGLYPTDIALHVIEKINVDEPLPIDIGPIDTDENQYVVPHAVYLDPTVNEQIIDDMIRLQLGWHWGVWEPGGLHETNPRIFMTKPPEEATCSIGRAELGSDFDAPRVRVDSLYNWAKVRWTDVAGRANVTEVLVPNPLLDQTGIPLRTLVLDAGVSTAAAAETFGTFALQLSQAAAKGGGSATIPGDVRTPGGRKPACLLKAGRDRLRITDMPDPGPLHETDTRRFDTFHVRRVETTVDQGGVPQTRVELGTGADLMEVLQARTAAALVNTR